MLNYLQEPGTEVHIKGITWVRIALTGQMTWIKTNQLNSIQLFGAKNALFGNATDTVANMTGFLVQGGTEARAADASGYARITFPTPFPNGLLTVMGFNGDGWAAPGVQFPSAGRQDVWGQSGFGSKADWVYAVTDANGNRLGGKQHRINWIAIGW